MELNGMFDQTTSFLKKVLDFRVTNQQVLSSNIANVNTPGYIPSHMEFEHNLDEALAGSGVKLAATQPGHIEPPEGLSDIGGKVVRQSRRLAIGDENEVTIEDEMVHLAENQILYEAAIQSLNKKYGLLKYVVQGGV